MDNSTNTLNWFEIPVLDMERAKHFYQVAFSIHMKEEVIANIQMSYFPSTEGSGKVSGALAMSEQHQPSPVGTLIYLNGNPNLSHYLEKIEGLGGNIILPKTAISPGIGFMAIFIDSEGNRIALHSQD